MCENEESKEDLKMKGNNEKKWNGSIGREVDKSECVEVGDRKNEMGMNGNE